MNTELREAWAEWLGEIEWDYFGTVTFREPVPQYRGMGVVNALSRTIRRYHPHRAFIGLEPHLSTMLHAHFLFQAGIALPYSKHMWAEMFRVYGRSRIEKARNNGDVAAYCSKYVVKSLGDYAIL